MKKIALLILLAVMLQMMEKISMKRAVGYLKGDDDIIKNYVLPPTEFKQMHRSDPSLVDLPSMPAPAMQQSEYAVAEDAYVPMSEYDQLPPPEEIYEQPPVKKPAMRALPKIEFAKPEITVTNGNKTKGLFLRVASRASQSTERARNLCSIFDEGSIPVVFFYADEKEYDFRSGIKTEWSDALAVALTDILGEKNIALRL